jgi:aspartyl-tRNA synthetase
MMTRTHTCGELRRTAVGQTVILNGWVQRRRDHGSVLFIDIRDRHGMTQIVFNAETVPLVHKQGEKLGSEDVIAVTGIVGQRPEGANNPNLATGDIEVLVQHVEILNEAKTPPFMIEDDAEVTDTLRLKYRYLFAIEYRQEPARFSTNSIFWKSKPQC